MICPYCEEPIDFLLCYREVKFAAHYVEGKMVYDKLSEDVTAEYMCPRCNAILCNLEEDAIKLFKELFE